MPPEEVLATAGGALAASSAAPVIAIPGEQSERLSLFNPATGETLAADYVLARDASIVGKGVTDSEGFTARHMDSQATRIQALVGTSSEWSGEYHADETLGADDGNEGFHQEGAQ